MKLTVVEDQDPKQPMYWDDAAELSISAIFELMPHASVAAEDSNILTFLCDQFEAMINVSKFSSDPLTPMYWADSWKILGSIAAAAGIKNSGFYVDHDPDEEMMNTFTPWMSKGSCVSTLIRKQHDYGHENISRFGRHGLLVRVHDKIARLNNLISRESSAKNESLCDTYVDIVGYSAIGVMWENNWFHLDLRS